MSGYVKSIYDVRVRRHWQTDRSAQAFIKRRAIEESAETIPGFLHGELVVSTGEPDLLCVLCSWTDEDAYQQWLASPLRAKQGPRPAGAGGRGVQDDDVSQRPCGVETAIIRSLNGHHWIDPDDGEKI